MEQTSKQIYKKLMAARKIIIVPHQNPDGDAIGAATALFEHLNSLSKEVAIFCLTPVGEKNRFLSHTEKITTNPNVFKDPQVDVIVVLDSSDLRYAGVETHLKNHTATIICIDHHLTNERFGHLNLVVTTAAATCEILYQFFRHNSVRINSKMATALLTGLTFDTGNFTNSATSSSALSISGELLRLGGNIKQITSNTVRNQSINSLKLWGAVLSRLEHNLEKNIIHTYITRADIQQFNVNESESEGISNFLNNLDNQGIALVLKEAPDGKIKGSLRTTRDDIDVSAIAKKFGGGGHKKAAGFTSAASIPETLAQVLQYI